MLNACMTEELTDDQVGRLGGQECWGVTPSDSMGTTVRRIGMAQGGNRIVIRQGGYYRPEMQTSAADLKRLEAKSLSAGSGPDGGYLVPAETEATVNRLLKAISPIRSIAGTGNSKMSREPQQRLSVTDERRPWVIRCHMALISYWCKNIRAWEGRHRLNPMK